ncbi:MAG: hypothetical protein QF464_05935 [Myxococcota bacterium]|jgi:methyl-accepting chemotaxis protein|nr:hypothetical protein [Myxococcota bacterium]
MSDELNLALAGLALLVITIVALKLLGNIMKAALVAAVAAVGLYLLLPQLATQEGAVGEVARHAQEASEDLDGTLKEIGRRAEAAVDGATQTARDLEAAAEATHQAAKTVSKVAPATP